MAGDPLELRRRVALLLPRPAWSQRHSSSAARCSRGTLWRRGERPDPSEWLPVLDDDGTRGVMLGELGRRVERLNIIVAADEAWVITSHAMTTGATLGEALARALVRVVGGTSS